MRTSRGDPGRHGRSRDDDTGVLGYGPFAPKRRARSAADAGDRERHGRHAPRRRRDSRQLATFYRGVGSSFGHATETRDIASWFAAAAALLLARRRCPRPAWADAFS